MMLMCDMMSCATCYIMSQLFRISLLLNLAQGVWEEMGAVDEPLCRRFGNDHGALGVRHDSLAGGLIVPLEEEEDTWPPWKWTEEGHSHLGVGVGGGQGGDSSGKVASTRVHFPDTRVGDVSVVKVALCNRSRKDAVIHIDTDAAHDSSFRLRHRQHHRHYAQG